MDNSEETLFKAMELDAKLEFLYRKQVAVRETVNKQSKAISALKDSYKLIKASVNFCKGAIAGLKFKLETRERQKHPFSGMGL